jgi:hypothetical protein
MKKRRMFYYLILASGWTVLLFHLSSMPYIDQDIRPYLQLFLKEETIQTWLGTFELTYNGRLVSVGNLGGYSFIEFFIRKGAHLFFYFMLGYVLVRYFITFLQDKKIRVLLLSCCMVIIIAMLDEYLQHMQPDRSGQWIDVWLDCTGGFLGIIGGFVSFITAQAKKSAYHSG